MAQRLTPGPARRLATAAAVAALGAGGLAGCATSDALALARQACGHVQRSLALYRAAQGSPTPADQQAKTQAALGELRLALPLAATAAGESPQWQALMTTLTESSRVPEGDLVIALQQQCADSSGGGQPGPATTGPAPGTTPTNPEPVGR